ncbi:MAG: hypothetical protein J6T62_05420 [Fibrobacter sp.]|jgi:hypothetical protein|nr:hypothetical protein [Fibrobacter sp.]MBO7550946.1 hypothetical protein [Fibrobacter sp.]
MQVKSFVLCEQIRQENTGKFILLGVFGTDVIENNIPQENRWKNPLFFGVYFALKVDRAVDAGFYTVKVEVDNGVVQTPELTLEIKKEGASNLQIPMSLALLLKGPSEVRLNIYKKDTLELVAEPGKFSIVNAER